MLTFLLLTLSLTQQADAAYAKRADYAEAQNAFDLYQQALTVDPRNVELFWKTSRTAWWLGDQAPVRSDKAVYFQKGVEYAKSGLALNPDCVECHFWLGGNYGSLGETKGVLKSLALVKPIRQEMAAVNRLNDRYDGGGGYRVLGIVDYQVPGIAGGSKKRSLEELNRAFAMDPQNPFTLYYLAEYYKTVGKKTEMREKWEALKALQPAETVRPEYDVLVKKGKKAYGE